MTDPGTQDKLHPIWALLSGSTFVGLLIFSGSLFAIGVLLWVVVKQLSAGMGLPFLALASVLLLLGALLVFTTLIHLIGLSDPKSALGLPEGSVRALLALALLGLFAIMASSVLTTSQTNPPTQVDEFGKQMLTLVGTLMTAVISFYFGSTPSSANMPPPPGLASSAPPQRVNDY
jgi:NADH:ubiquinone oxidoreductase subunit 6 (subunit J)